MSMIWLVILLLSNWTQNPGRKAMERSAVGLSRASIGWTAAWSHDDHFVAIGNDQGELSVYETKDWKKIRTWKYQATTITRVEWNPRFPILAVAGLSHVNTDTIVQLFDMSKNKVLSTLPDTVYGRGVSWSADGEQVVYVGSKGRISLYSKEGSFIKSLSFTNPGSLFDIDWHPKEDVLLAVEDEIYLFDIQLNSVVMKLDDGSANKGILCCQWHPSGEFFVTGDYGHENEGGEPSYIKFWDREGRQLKRIQQSKWEYRNIRWSKDGNYLAAAGDGLLVFDRDGKLLSHKLFGENLWGLCWNNKGDRIITSDQSGTVRVTDLKGKVLKTFVQ